MRISAKLCQSWGWFCSLRRCRCVKVRRIVSRNGDDRDEFEMTLPWVFPVNINSVGSRHVQHCLHILGE
jgi:hypothetical protein